jgi:hypothetical protein
MAEAEEADPLLEPCPAHLLLQRFPERTVTDEEQLEARAPGSGELVGGMQQHGVRLLGMEAGSAYEKELPCAASDVQAQAPLGGAVVRRDVYRVGNDVQLGRGHAPPCVEARDLGTDADDVVGKR